MNTVHTLLAILCLLAASAGASEQEATADIALFRQAAGRACRIVGDPIATRGAAGPTGTCRVWELTRTPLLKDVTHYQLELQVGPGEHERIRLHRVVRELAPYVPVHAADAILLAHGDRFPFTTTFLATLGAPSIPDEQSMAVFLAREGVDVWGIDFRWALVPEETADLAFMADWGLATDATDLGLALAVARGVRAATGSGGSALHLAGFSRGGHAGYVYLDAESQLPPALRSVSGFIPLDIAIKLAEPELAQAACQRHQEAQARIEAGDFALPGANIRLAGELALTAPDEPSPFVPFLTNAQLLKLVGADASPAGLVPYFHQVGGEIDPLTLDTVLLYSQGEHFFAYNAGIAAFEPRRVLLEAEAVTCPEIDSPLDDHFGEITVPVLYVGAGGGFGEFGIYNTTLLGSTDVTVHMVDLRPPEERALDFGHADLFLADEAETLVWRPILDWIRAH